MTSCFSKIQDDFKVTPSPGAIRVKEYHQKKKELLLQSPVLEECDQCGFKTSKYLALYRHKREHHTVLRQKCTECEYSNIYPNRIRQHYQQVHLGMKRSKLSGNCRRKWCEYLGSKNARNYMNIHSSCARNVKLHLLGMTA